MVAHPHRSSRRISSTEHLLPGEYIHSLNSEHDIAYEALRQSVIRSFGRSVMGHDRLFTTDAGDLFTTYMKHIPLHDRQVHNCNTCRRFINQFGHLVVLTDDGMQWPVMWDAGYAPPRYQHVAQILRTAVWKANVTGPFLFREDTLGDFETGHWTHFAVDFPSSMRFRHSVLSPNQAAAEKREDFRTVETALAEFSLGALAQALDILKAEALQSSEKFIGPVKWLIQLHLDRKAAPDDHARDNVLWKAVASAPVGYCHPRASVVGSLLEDIVAGHSFSIIKARFDTKLHPLKYQRPQVAPAQGNIDQAEKLVEQMGITLSLERRFARLEDCETVWTPAKSRRKAGERIISSVRQARGVFDNVTARSRSTKELARSILPNQTMTWVKFASTIMSEADEIELYVPFRGNFVAFTAAKFPTAPQILKWDDEPPNRNTVAWYLYHGGSPASQWKLHGSTFVKVTGVVPAPPLWGRNPRPHLGDGAVLVLEGAVDTQKGQGNALFPEFLRSELHAVRATIEAYSKKAKLYGQETASACGYRIPKGPIDCRLRVTADGRTSEYTIDRWD